MNNFCANEHLMDSQDRYCAICGSSRKLTISSQYSDPYATPSGLGHKIKPRKSFWITLCVLAVVLVPAIIVGIFSGLGDGSYQDSPYSPYHRFSDEQCEELWKALPTDPLGPVTDEEIFFNQQTDCWEPGRELYERYH